jgi:hypothetical protein
VNVKVPRIGSGRAFSFTSGLETGGDSLLFSNCGQEWLVSGGAVSMIDSKLPLYRQAKPRHWRHRLEDVRAGGRVVSGPRLLRVYNLVPKVLSPAARGRRMMLKGRTDLPIEVVHAVVSRDTYRIPTRPTWKPGGACGDLEVLARASVVRSDAGMQVSVPPVGCDR